MHPSAQLRRSKSGHLDPDVSPSDTGTVSVRGERCRFTARLMERTERGAGGVGSPASSGLVLSPQRTGELSPKGDLCRLYKPRPVSTPALTVSGEFSVGLANRAPRRSAAPQRRRPLGNPRIQRRPSRAARVSIHYALRRRAVPRPAG